MKRGRQEAPEAAPAPGIIRRGAVLSDRSNTNTGSKDSAFAKKQQEKADQKRRELEAKAAEESRQRQAELLERWKLEIAAAEEEEQYYSRELSREKDIQKELRQAIEEHIHQQDEMLHQLATQLSEEKNTAVVRIDAIKDRSTGLQMEVKANAGRQQSLEEDTCLRLLDVDDVKAQCEGVRSRIQAQLGVLDGKLAEEEKARQALLRSIAQEELMQSATYGVSDEVGRMVGRSNEIDSTLAELFQKGKEIEITRRVKFNRMEELKGTIRVYCRVKGGPTTAKIAFPVGEKKARPHVDGTTSPATPLPVSPAFAQANSYSCGPSFNSAAPRISNQSNSDASSRSSVDSGIGAQCLEITSSRLNATSTAMKDTASAFSFDRVYQPDCTQAEIFTDVGALVDCAVDGYKVCILAYGQTGSGKTYTMEGVVEPPNDPQAGIIPRAIEKIFSRAEVLKAEGWTYTMSCYFIEIYVDTIRDLLETSEAYQKAFAEGKDVKDRHEIIHKGKSDTIVTNVKERTVRSPVDVHKLLQTAVSNRSVAKTLMNDRSSRSHSIFTMKIEGVNQSINQRSIGTLCLVDLAGSERVNESGAQGQTFKEAVAINRSLSSLGDCISALGSNGSVVPAWRANKLTYLLQNYLGGDGAKMLMFVTVSGQEEHVAESVNSLRFAAKVNSTRLGPAKKKVLSLNP